jgi:hypothetical protein
MAVSFLIGFVAEPNKRIKSVRYAHPTRNGEAPLLAAYARR